MCWIQTCEKALGKRPVTYSLSAQNYGAAKYVARKALVRWQSPERGLIPPLEFISCRRSGLIVPLGRWVILDVVRQRVRDGAIKGINLRVAVNFSARQLADQTRFYCAKALYDLVRVLPDRCRANGKLLIENDAGAMGLSSNLVSSALQIHLDDFGTGYSSLSNSRFLDAVKLDQAFVRDHRKQPLSQSLVRAIVAVAQALNLQVICRRRRKC
ncbi:EAL domain-containing protein [Salmonella enterica subsp. enterica]|nr:EAL domain-containing protein [Salmonella enterica subsp. enterica]